MIAAADLADELIKRGAALDGTTAGLAAAHTCFSDEIADEIVAAVDVLRQLTNPTLAFDADVCALCGNTPRALNELRGQLLDQYIHPPVPDPVDQLDIVELTEALRRANATIAARNHEIRQLRQETAA